MPKSQVPKHMIYENVNNWCLAPPVAETPPPSSAANPVYGPDCYKPFAAAIAGKKRRKALGSMAFRVFHPIGCSSETGGRHVTAPGMMRPLMGLFTLSAPCT